MNAHTCPPATRRSTRRFWLWGLLATPVLLLLLFVAGVANLFRLNSDARALRNEVIKSSGVAWRQQIALNAGALTLGAVRTGLSFVRLDPGARAALKSVRAAGVGVYQLPDGTPSPDRTGMLAAADSVMTIRGWQRVVGVIDGEDLVAVYLPKKVSTRRVKCCVLVVDEKEMVLVNARVNPEPLLEFALAQPGLSARVQHLAQR